MHDVFGSTGSATRLLFKAVGSEVASGSPPSFLPFRRFRSPFPASNRLLFIQIDSIGRGPPHNHSRPCRGGRGSKDCLPSHPEQIRGKHARTD